MFSNLFGSPCTLDIALDHQPGRKSSFLDLEKKGDKVLVFSDGEDVSGTAVICLKPGKKLTHGGIKVELMGRLSVLTDNSPPYTFFTISKDLEPPGILYESKSYKWKFPHVDKPHETYNGVGAKLRYFVRLSLNRPYGTTLSKEVYFAVHNAIEEIPSSNNIKMEVGIEDCLHIEFEYDKSHYHIKDVVVGKVYFLLVRIKIKYMELDIIRTETVKTGTSQHTETETVTRFEIMDGPAVKCDCIPVRLYLSGYELTPSYQNIQGRYSVKYFLNLVLVDEEDRRYFKKHEIVLYRKRADPATPAAIKCSS